MVHTDLTRIEGPNLVLRLIRLEDADYVHALRTDPAYNRHLSEVRGTAEDQRRWIEDYKAREADLRELYYVTERRDGVRCGLVRLYDIGKDSFTWGSWVLDCNKTRKAALESAVLSFGIGFVGLGLPTANVDAHVENEHAQVFNRRLGMTELHRDSRRIYFAYLRDRFLTDRPSYMAILEGGHEA
ncbi:GNAT family N-acetyltransferase [Rhodomicrobium vannielii ATCC 17100]|uniref:GNAT family N-acetyltransferase n=1 Tax=Rhodomicrobium vannielii TaxID=1069 RepID=UPI001918AD5D|nr:GNAT family N-acetyltransferase [Rhodomicrobium vannielii]MBJ7533233.1 GNAT family N-acetyltransferase [Rhodomicrobium vannielii ATCC 17100]